ncbi:hypothetical protein AYX13_07129, partial [Cryptococcus neoformans]
TLPEDPSPGSDKVYQNTTTGDYVINNITGIRLGVRWRLDGQGYDVSSSKAFLVHNLVVWFITD